MYNTLLCEASTLNIEVQEKYLNKRIKGLYSDNVIWINKNIETSTEKACVLAEELGHYYTSAGNILDQSQIPNIKQERQARIWAAKKLIPLERFIEAFNYGCTNRYEVAEYLDVTETFLEQSLTYCKEKFGLEVKIDENHMLFLEPLDVYKII